MIDRVYDELRRFWRIALYLGLALNSVAGPGRLILLELRGQTEGMGRSLARTAQR